MKEKIIYYYKKYNLHYLLLIAFLYAFKLIIYEISNTVSTNYHTINMQIDNWIPFCKYFIIFYFTYYWFTPLILYLTSYSDKKKFYRLIISIIVTCILANICFFIYQVKMTRPEIVGNDFFDLWVKWLYTDLDPTALNCFPSIHAVMGVVTVIGSYKNNKLPKWLQVVGITLGVGCTISTVFIKQHYFIDMVIGSILISLVYLLILCFDKKLTNKKATK